MGKKQSRGITLIAVVLTIIVLLILATIIMQAVIGENGIISKVKEAANKTKVAQEKEYGDLETFESYIKDSNYHEKISSLFSWDIDAMDNYSDLKNVTDYLKIDTIYSGKEEGLEFDLNSAGYSLLLNFADQNNIDIWLMEGDRFDVENNKIQKIKNLIDEIYEYNSKSERKIKGLSLDIEFFLSSTYKDGTNDKKLELFRQYVDFVKECYQYAKSKDIKLANCIPTWLDKLNEEYLEDLIANGCDYVQVMNYIKSDMINSIDKEIEIAKKYNKKIENISELQIPNSYNGVTDEETFHNDGIIACIEKVKEIKQKYTYNLLTQGYHYYLPVKKLVSDVVDMTKTFDYELYPKDDKTKESIDVDQIYLLDGSKKIYGMPFEINGEYIYRFYGIEYDKKYQVVLQDENYEYNKEIIYNQSEDRIKYGDVNATHKEKGIIKLELYGWLENYTEEVSIESGRLICDGNVVEGKISSVRSSKGEEFVNILLFSGLEYNKEYTLQIEADGYTILGEYKYIFEDKNTTKYYRDVKFNKN